MNELIFPSADAEVEQDDIVPFARFVSFVLADQAYGIAVDRVREVLRLSEIASVPGAPRACRGVINLRGHIVSVLDLRQLLHLPAATDSQDSRMLVIDHPNGMLALQVDRVMDLTSVPETRIERTPAVASQPVPVAGLIHRNEGPLFLLDPEFLLEIISKELAA